MSHWVLLVAPLVLASLVMLFAFVGCGLNAEGTQHGEPTETRDEYKDVVAKHENVVGYWRLGEAIGETKAADSSPKGNHGTYAEGVKLEQPGLLAGDTDTAAQFGAGHVELPFVLDPAGAFTIECLVKPDALGAAPTIVSQLDGTGTGRSLLFVDGATSHFASNLGGTARDSNFTAAVDKTFHVAFTSAGGADGAWVFYVDGAETATGTATGDSADGGWLIGVNKLLAEPWNGTIDEVAVYDVVLDAATIQAHFALATAVAVP